MACTRLSLCAGAGPELAEQADFARSGLRKGIKTSFIKSISKGGDGVLEGLKSLILLNFFADDYFPKERRNSAADLKSFLEQI